MERSAASKVVGRKGDLRAPIRAVCLVGAPFIAFGLGDAGCSCCWFCIRCERRGVMELESIGFFEHVAVAMPDALWL